MAFANSVSDFVKGLSDFSYELSSLDHVWEILFPDKTGKWNHLHVNRYRHTFYLTHTIKGLSLEAEPGKRPRAMEAMGARSRDIDDDGGLSDTWNPLITSAQRWLNTALKDWIKANKRVQVEYPLRQRYGVVPNALIRASLADVYRLDRELGRGKTTELVRLVEDGFFVRSENTQVPSMAADDYFQYCRIAYTAARRRGETIDGSLSGREMYLLYADGRHEGLLDIDPASEKEFAEWIDGNQRIGWGEP